MKLTTCPLEGVGEDVWSALEAADWAKDPGFLPAAGGTLDQAAIFLAACRAVWREQARVEAARTKR